MQIEKIQMLRTFPLFQALTSNAVMNLIDNMAVGNLKMFEVIYHEGQPPDYIYIIKEGQVEIDAYQTDKYTPQDDFEKIRKPATLKNSKRQRMSLALLQPGCQFGHEDILANRVRETRAIAKSSNCELLMIPAKVWP